MLLVLLLSLLPPLLLCVVLLPVLLVELRPTAQSATAGCPPPAASNSDLQRGVDCHPSSAKADVRR
jgi:hypothetical protein